MSLPYSNKTTSRASAERQEEKAPPQRAQILARLRQGSLTRYELSQELGIDLKSVEARVWQLLLDGKVVELTTKRADAHGNHEGLLLKAVPKGLERPLTTTLSWKEAEALFCRLAPSGACYGPRDVFEWLGLYFKRARLLYPMYKTQVPEVE